MITFANAREEEEWDSVLPELQTILEEFGHWAAGERLPITVITCLGRTKEENAKIYGGVERKSWHVADSKGHIRAADLRIRHYTAAQLAKVIAWFNARCPDVKKYELIYKPHGTGPHIHLGVRP